MLQIKINKDNPDWEDIKAAVKENDGYCPCELLRNPDTKCMCKAFREAGPGVCHCGLYIKYDTEEECVMSTPEKLGGLFVKSAVMIPIVSEFQKVSKEQWVKDTGKAEVFLDEVNFPTLATDGSAGHDFYSPMEYHLEPGVPVLIPSGFRCKMDPGWWLGLFPRSSMGFKYGMKMLNTVGVVDSDYYNAENEGHIMFKVEVEKPLVLKAGERFAQGIFIPYGVAANAEILSGKRTGGMGSTGV